MTKVNILATQLNTLLDFILISSWDVIVRGRFIIAPYIIVLRSLLCDRIQQSLILQ
jgi:hypothetical protein